VSAKIKPYYYLVLLRWNNLWGGNLNPIIIWSCYDGIIYGEVTKLTGEFRWGGRKPREGAANDQKKT